MKFYNKTQRRNRPPPFIDILATYDNCFRKKNVPFNNITWLAIPSEFLMQ